MLLPHNYHSHTARCRHASGEDREYVEAAILAGMETIGFSDHTPYPFGNGYRSSIRMDCSEIAGYVSSILRLRDEYKKDIRILLGVEAEYYPLFFEAWQKLVADYPFDYFILGQHCIGNEIEDDYSGRPTFDPARLAAYVDQVIEAMQTGIYLYLAHPDLLAYIPCHTKHYKAEMRRLCEAAKGMSVPLEINLLGMREHRLYPNPSFWRIVCEVGNDVVLGSDAHRPIDMYHEETVIKACKMVKKYGLHLIEKPL